MALIGTWLGATDATTYAARLAADGAAFSWCSARWGQIQPGGTGDYTWTALDAEVAARQAAGLTVGIKIQAWLDEEGTPVYPAVPKNYTSWVIELVQRYVALGVTRYALENEASTYNPATGAGWQWGDTVAAYGDLMQLAYPYVAANGGTLSDSMMGPTGLAIVYMKALYDAGNMTQANLLAYQMWLHTMGEQGLGTLAEPPWSAGQWTAFWALDGVQRALDGWAELQDHQTSVDQFGWHWYGVPAPWLAATLTYALAYLPGKPHTCWELGYTWPLSWGDLGVVLYTQAVGRLLLTALAGGAQDVAWFSYLYRAVQSNPNRYHPGLLEADGTARQAETAYRVIATKLTGFTAAAAQSWGATVQAYAFTVAGRTVYAAWTTSGTATVNVAGLSNPCLVTDVATGVLSYVNPAAVPLTVSPVFIETMPTVMVRVA